MKIKSHQASEMFVKVDILPAILLINTYPVNACDFRLAEHFGSVGYEGTRRPTSVTENFGL
jgi:hypothetical protein